MAKSREAMFDENVTMTEAITAVLRSGDNPMFSRGKICNQLHRCQQYGSHHPYYSIVGYYLNKMEKQGLVWVYRHVNQGTTYIWKGRVKDNGSLQT